MLNRDLREELESLLEDLDIEDLVAVHNEYCEGANYMDDWCYNMCELDEILSGATPTEIINSLNSDFNTNDGYFYYDGYANLSSFSWYGDSPIDVTAIADYILDDGDDFGVSEIENFIAEHENDEEDEDQGLTNENKYDIIYVQ